MQQRFDLNTLEPNAYPALLGMERHIRESGLSAAHRHLIKLYASQLNGCSYCVDSHAKESLHDGLPAQKLLQLATFSESPAFDEKERAILQLTREVTFIAQRVSDATYTHAVGVLGEEYTAKVLMAVIVINMWNRVGITTNMVPAG
jgi:AhpD family alkylhydroperoxidase